MFTLLCVSVCVRVSVCVCECVCVCVCVCLMDWMRGLGWNTLNAREVLHFSPPMTTPSSSRKSDSWKFPVASELLRVRVWVRVVEIGYAPLRAVLKHGSAVFCVCLRVHTHWHPGMLPSCHDQCSVLCRVCYRVRLQDAWLIAHLRSCHPTSAAVKQYLFDTIPKFFSESFQALNNVAARIRFH